MRTESDVLHIPALDRERESLGVALEELGPPCARQRRVSAVNHHVERGSVGQDESHHVVHCKDGAAEACDDAVAVLEERGVVGGGFAGGRRPVDWGDDEESEAVNAVQNGVGRL